MRWIFFALLPALLCGCWQEHVVIKLKPDGSGTLEVTELYRDGSFTVVPEKDGNKEFYSEERSRSSALKMGAEFVSVEKLTVKKGPDVLEGQKSIYSFKDVTKLKLELGQFSKRAEVEIKRPYSIGLKKSETGSTICSINFNRLKPEESKELKDQLPQNKLPLKEDKQEIEKIVREIYAGMHVSLIVIPEGEILKTNSDYVENGRVILYDFPVGDEPNLEFLVKLQKTNDQESLTQFLKEYKNFKLANQTEFTLEFKAK